MSTHNTKLRDARENTVIRKKMYKANGTWQTAGIGTLALAGVAVTAGVTMGQNANEVHADTVDASASQAATTQTQSASVSEGSGSVSAPAQSVNTTSATAAVNSGNTAIANTVTTSHNDVEDAGGTVDQTSTETVTVTSANAESTTQSVASAAQSQVDNVTAVASADSNITSASKGAEAVTTAVGGKITANSASDATKMTTGAIKSYGDSVASNIVETGAANGTVSEAVSNNIDVVESAGGTMTPGKAVDTSSMTSAEIAAAASQAAEMVNVTGSADSAIISASNAYTSGINAAGGVLSKSSAINTADNMTKSDVESSVKSQVAKISETASADVVISTAESNAKSAVEAIGGTLKPGEATDTTDMTSDEIASMVSAQSTMVSATAQGDKYIGDAVSNNTGFISAAGGSIAHSGDVNTADDMTYDEVLSVAKSQEANINATGSGDADIKSNVDANSGLITSAGGTLTQNSGLDMTGKTADEIAGIASQITENISHVGTADSAMVAEVASALPTVSDAGGTMTAGSALDASSMTPEEIDSEAARQSVMISATASADADVTSTATSAEPAITGNGGTISQSGTINTADDMTESDVESSVKSQDSKISATASADTVIGNEVAKQSDSISNAGGVEKPGAVIDVTNMTEDEIASIASHQSAMVSATGSADSHIVSKVSSATPAITQDIGGKSGTITLDSNINTADNMTTDEIASTIASQDAKIEATVAGDNAIGSAAKANSDAIAAGGGKEVAGSAIDTSSMTPEEVQSLVDYQVGMLNATGSATTDVLSTASSAKPTIEQDIGGVAGTITQDGIINTADNMTKDEIASTVASQDARIKQTADADQSIADVVDANSAAISAGGGKELAGSAIDTTNMTADEIASIVAHQTAMVNATGSADTHVLSDVKSATPAISGNGGKITSNGIINTADNMTTDEIESSVQSQSVNISATASADTVIGDAVASNKAAIEGFGGTEKPGKAIDVSSMTAGEIASIAASQKAMVDATGSADTDVSTAVKFNSGAIANAGGTITNSGTINTADDMTVEEIASTVASQDDNIYAVGFADGDIKSAQNSVASASKPFGGDVVTGKALDATKMSVDEIKSMAASEVSAMSHVASNNQQLSDTQTKVSDVVNAVGGTVSAGKAIDVTDMTPSELASFASSQNATLSAVGDGDRQIGSAVTNNMNSIELAGGLILSAGASNMAGKTASEVLSNAKSQASNIVATGQGDYEVSQEASAVKSEITANGGVLTKNPASDVTSLTGSQIKSLADSSVDNLSGTGSANVAVSSALGKYTSDVTAFDGKVVKGSAKDVSGMTAAEIGKIADSEVATLSATAAGDVKLSNAVKSNSGAIIAAGGTLDRGSDINTASMTASQVASQADSQAQNISDTASADTKITSAVNATKDSMALAGGVAHVGTAKDASSMTASQMDSLATSEATQLKNAASADSTLASHVADNKSAVTAIGGTITSAKATDATDFTSAQMSAAVSAQGSNMSAVAMGDNMLSDGVANVSKATTTKGSAVDMTGKTSAEIASNVASQVTKIGETQTANDTIASGIASATLIPEMGGSISPISGTVDTTKMTSSQIAAMVNSDVAKLEATSSADGNLSNDVAAVKSTITKNGGTITSDGTSIDTTNMTTSAIKTSVDSQEADMNNVASADSVINSAVTATDAVKTYDGTKAVTSTTATNADSMTSAQRSSYAASVAATVNTVASADTANEWYAAALKAAGATVTTGTTTDVTTAGAVKDDTAALSAVLSTQNSKVALSKATASTQTVIASQVASAKADDLTVKSGTTVHVSNAEQLASVVAKNSAALKTKIASMDALDEALNQTKSTPSLSSTGYTSSGSWQALNYNNAANNVGGTGTSVVLSSSDSKNYNNNGVTIATSTLDAAHVVKTINWGNQTPTLVSGSWVSKTSNVTGYNVSGSTKTMTVTSGSVLKFPGIVSLEDGSTTDLYVTFTATGGTYASGLGVGIFNLGGAINSYVPSTSQGNTLKNTMTFKIGDGSDKYMMVSTISDIDVGQTASFGSSDIVGIGGGLKAQGGIGNVSVKSDANLGNYLAGGYGINRTEGDGLTDLHSYPDGVALIAHYGNSWAVSVQNDSSTGAWGVAQGMFGKGSAVATTIVDKTVTLDNVAYDYVPETVAINSYTTKVSALSTTYTPYSTKVHEQYNYTYNPLSTTYSAMDVTTTPLKTHYNVLSDVGGMTPFSTSYTPYSTSFTALSDDGGYNPEIYTTTPLSTTYQNYSTDGSTVPDGHKFTGYTPLDTTYQTYETDGSNIPPLNPDGSINPKFTGFAPLSTTYETYETDADTVPEGDKFTGFTPLSTTYENYSTDGTDIPPLNPDGSINPKFTGYTPLSVTYKAYSSDGVNVPDGHTFTGYRPISTSYSPLDTTYVSLSSDGTTVPDGHMFTGYTPYSTTYSPYSSDGANVPDGHNFTGYNPYDTEYTPLSAKYHYYKDVNGDKPDTVSPAAPVSSLIGGTAQSGKLPQTGEEVQALAVLGLAMLALALGMSAIGKKKREDVTVDEPTIG